MYLKNIKTDKWDKKIECCLIKLFGPIDLEQPIQLQQYYASSKNKFEIIQSQFEHIIKQCYDEQLKLSRIFEPVLFKYVFYHLTGKMSNTEKSYVYESIGNLLSNYNHVYLPKYKLIIIDYKFKTNI